MCDVLVVYTVDQGLFELWSCTNMKPIYQAHAKFMFYLRNKCPL